MRWTDVPIHFIDFEGGAVSGVLEYGVVTLRGGAIMETRTRLCRASGPIKAADAAVHGLERAALAGCAPFAGEFDYFAGLRETGVLAAHYAGVENALLKSVWPYPRVSPDFARAGRSVVDWGPWIDSARIYGELYPRCESTRLENVIVAFGLQGELDVLAAAHCPPGRRRFHAALYDALAGALLLARLAREPEVCDWEVARLLMMSTMDPEKRDGFSQRELFG